MAALTLPVYILVPQVYADTLGLGLGTVGIVLLIARIFDMLTDPVAGWLSDQYPIKGRHRRPWILVGMVITAVGAWGVLSPFTDMVSPLYLGVASVILYAGWTLINIPLYALGTELSGHEQGRRRLAAWREIMVLLGTVLTLLIVGSFSQEPLVAMTWVKYFTLSVGFAGLVLLWRLPKPIASRSPKKELRINDYFSVFKNKDFRHLLSAYIINGLANGLPATTFLLFVQQVIKAPEYQGYFLLIYFVAGLLAAPIWVKLANKYSHPARIWCIAMIWACSIFMLVGFTSEGTIWLYGLICIGSGLSLGADMIYLLRYRPRLWLKTVKKPNNSAVVYSLRGGAWQQN